MSEADLRCYHHPEREATSQCDRCGDYLCNDCVNEHDELHLCDRCIEDIRPREEIGKSAKIACVINALVVSFFWLAMLLHAVLAPPLSVSLWRVFVVIPTVMSATAISLALIGIRGRASGELPFRLSILISAGCSALFVPVALFRAISSDTKIVICLELLLTSVMLLGSSVCKRTRPVWALILALLAPLVFGIWLLPEIERLLRTYRLMRLWTWSI